MLAEQIRALVFDVFGTVVDWRSSIAREAEACCRERAGERDWHAFADAWRARYQPAMQRVRAGNRGFVRLDVLHRENLLEVLEEFTIAGLSEAEIDHLNRAWHRLDGWPDSVPGMVRLKTRYILAAMSNGNVSLIVNMAKHAGIPWDMVLGAEIAQQYKPRPETYLTGVDWLGLRPEQVMMVAAHNDDLVAARGCGLRTGFVARPQEHGPGQRTDRRDEHGFDLAVASMTELADRLGCA